MRRFRFSIGSLIGFTLICGVAFGALKESTDLWERSTFSLTLLVLLTSVLLAIHCGGARREFWLGFAFFGCVYLGLTLLPSVETRLITSQGLGYLHSKLVGQSPRIWSLTLTAGTGIANQPSPVSAFDTVVNVGGPGQIWTVNNGNILSAWGGSPENFVKIGHTLIALLLAWFGGMVSWQLARGRRPSEE
jgi:hypothetical protein